MINLVICVSDSHLSEKKLTHLDKILRVNGKPVSNGMFSILLLCVFFQSEVMFVVLFVESDRSRFLSSFNPKTSKVRVFSSHLTVRQFFSQNVVPAKELLEFHTF